MSVTRDINKEMTPNLKKNLAKMESHAQLIFSKVQHLIPGLDAEMMAHSSILTPPELPAFVAEDDALRDQLLNCACPSIVNYIEQIKIQTHFTVISL